MMILKATMAAGLIATAMAINPLPASAKTSVHIGIGGYPCYGWRCNYGYGPGPFYGGYYGGGYGFYDPAPIYRPRPVYRLSCGEVRSIVRSQGFRNVRARECGGSTYSFFARRGGEPVIVRASARTGNIRSVRPIY